MLSFYGDASHAMSPAGGVGINLAIQDAVATSNILGPFLAEGKVVDDNELQRVQARREWPNKVIQSFQLRIHRQLLKKTDGISKPFSPGLTLRFTLKMFGSPIRKLASRLIGLGIRRELPEA
jgi:2-polyprenyl-6-methoxyphenol hydroxylase-like FAD-dependent oxidoreductase